ncbi:hypothetical protein [Simkania sp.]|uniref:hypothetical protein n=1 Tax=Simkania sp. TaxID=34094 RepID=UPI003B51C95A
MTVLAPDLGESASDCLAWRAHNMNIISQIFDSDINTISNSYNDVISNSANGDYSQNEQDVDTAMDAANQMLWYAFTCPPFSENTDLQTTLVNSLSDLFCVDPVYTDQTITYDENTPNERTETVSVPKFEADGDQNPDGWNNDTFTSYNWDGEYWDAEGGPSTQGYQGYLGQQSDWNQDITMMSDNVDTISAQDQAMMQQNTSMQEQLNGSWNDMIQQKAKGVAYQIRKEITGS